MCVCVCVCVCVFTNLISTSIHDYQKKEKKTPGTRDKNISNHRPGEKEKILLDKKKEKANPVTSLEKNQDMQSVGQKKTKTLCKHCNAYNYKSAQHEWSQL